MLVSLRRFDSEDQHVLGEPGLFARKIGTDAERETFFAQQNIAAVTRANGNDRVVLRKMTDEAPLRINIQQRMRTTVPLRVWIVAEPFDGDLAHTRHDPHV